MEVKTFKSKLLAIFMAIVLVCGLTPMPAFADEIGDLELTANATFITQPVEGNTTGKVKAVVAGDAQYSTVIQSGPYTSWRDDDGWTKDETFVAGKTYYLQVRFTPASGSTFKTDGSITAKINGKTATNTTNRFDYQIFQVAYTVPAHTHSGVKNTSASANDYWFCEGCRSYFKDAACTQKISNISTWTTTIYNATVTVTQPVAGEVNNPSGTVGDSSLYTVADSCWKDSKRVKMDSGAMFADGETYTYSVKLQPVNSAYRIDENSVLINGKTATRMWDDYYNADFTTGTHMHSMDTYVGKVEATCKDAGKEGYYQCGVCHKYFADAFGKNEITDLSTWGIIPKLTTHEEPTVWHASVDQHWGYCPVCHGIIRENHVYDNDLDETCNVCNGVRSVSSLAFADSASYDVPAGTKGSTYTATTAFTATGGTAPYNFTVSPAVSGMSINGKNQLVFTRPATQGPTTATIKVADGTGATRTITINVGAVTETPLASNEITSVDITAFAIPVHGKKPFYALTLPTDAKYRFAQADEFTESSEPGWVNGVFWNRNAGAAMKTDDIFIEDVSYYCQMKLVPKEGYSFAAKENLAISINGDQSLVYRSSVGQATVGGKKVNRCDITTTPFEAIADETAIEIPKISIYNIVSPIEGNTPSYAASLPVDAKYHFASADEIDVNPWYSGKNNESFCNGTRWPIKSDEVFEAKKQYQAEYLLVPNEGYRFTKDTTVELNYGDMTFYLPFTGKRAHDYQVTTESLVAASPSTADKHEVTIVSGGTGATGAGSYKEGDTVTITAGTYSDAAFNEWQSDDVVITNADKTTATFTMPAKNVTVTATWTGTGTHATHDIVLVPGKDPTFTEEGYISHFKCWCGKLFIDASGDTQITNHDDIIIPRLDYAIIKGMNGTFTKGLGTTLEFTANGPEADCTGVKVDGAVVDAANYTRKSGSTIITFNNAYLEGLADGSHTVTVLYGDREEATTNFTVEPAATNPDQVTYTLTTVVEGGNGTVNPAGSSVINEGEEVTLIFAPDNGYEIDKVTVNGVETGVLANVLTLTMNEDKRVGVIYKQTQGGEQGGAQSGITDGGADNKNSGDTDKNKTKTYKKVSYVRTADDTQVALWIALMFAASIGIAVGYVGRKKRNNGK